jgi:hypothetical protein
MTDEGLADLVGCRRSLAPDIARYFWPADTTPSMPPSAFTLLATLAAPTAPPAMVPKASRASALDEVG